MSTSPAYTRTQWLVTAAATILLLALAIPYIAHARTASRRSACLSNLRQFSAALHDYTVDFNTLLPHPLQEPDTQQNFWTHTLAVYIPDFQKVLQCPAADHPNPRIFTAGTATSPWNQTDTARSQLQSGAYTINGWLYATHFSSSLYLGDDGAFLASELRTDDVPPLPTIIDPDSFYHLPLVRQPATIPAFADAIWSETFPAPSDSLPTDTSLGDGPHLSFHLGQLFIDRHGTTPPAINTSFLDGHAETTPLSNLSTLPWQAHWISPTPPTR